MTEQAAGDGCVVCGRPRSPKDGIEDRCGHHRRQLLRNRAKEKGLPNPTKSRGTTRRTPKPEPESPLEALSPHELRLAHIAGQHEKIAPACVLCIRRAGGKIYHIEEFR